MSDEMPAEVSPADIIMAYRQVAASEAGQVVLQDLIRKFGYSRSSTFQAAGDQEPYRTFIHEGQRSVMVHIGNMIDADPALVEQAGRPIHDEITGVETDDERTYDEPLDIIGGD